MIGYLFFALCSGINIAFSWRWLGNPRHYGFFRFFAFEAVCGLLLLQASGWFDDPLSFPQLVSWILLFGSFLLAIHGFWALSVYGRPTGNFEQTTALVTQGAYRYVRHPMYGSLLLLVCGAVVKSLSAKSVAVAMCAILFLTLTALVEERENLVRFGAEYVVYRKRTRMFVPWVL